MATIFRKIRGKRKLSSELDSRWGDVSISSPNEGSWSQGFQPSGSTVNTNLGSPEQEQRPSSMNSLRRRSTSSHKATKPSPSSPISVDSMPTGHYNANIRNRPRTSHRQPPATGLGIGMLQNGYSAWDDASSDGMSSDDEIRDGGGRTRQYLTVDMEEDYSRASRSPPLSVTSRMRRHRHQSTTEPSPFIPRTTSSRHASFTSSAPTASTEGSRIGYKHRQPPFPERKHVRRPKPLELEADRGPELVPSYDELYG